MQALICRRRAVGAQRGHTQEDNGDRQDGARLLRAQVRRCSVELRARFSVRVRVRAGGLREGASH